jgi:hypothetical protein
MTTKWEYRTLKIPTKIPLLADTDFDAEQFDRVLNDMGADGWELVSVTSLQTQRSGSARFVLATLKRPKR